MPRKIKRVRWPDEEPDMDEFGREYDVQTMRGLMVGHCGYCGHKGHESKSCPNKGA